ncbi:MAG: hypothetical protein F4X95_02865 [Oligoflexia bacterium]|nr:hypothetical protein [Oligoflexia bacterium]
MNYFSFFFLFLVLTLNIGLFNGCSGAASKRAEILSSLTSDLEIATPPPPATQEEAEKILDEEAVTEKPAKPDDPEEFNYFPYDLQMDTIAYMSCENPVFFTFKAGAYFDRSGLRLSEYFLQQLGSMSASALETLIKSSTKYHALPWLSYAHINNLTTTLPNSVIQISSLRLYRLVKDLVATGTTRIRPGSDSIEARMSYGPNIISSAVLGLNSGGWKLALTYKGGKENKTLHKTGGETGVDIYGRIYTLNLAEITSAPLLSRYALRSISEEKRPEAPPQKTWTCPESLRFEIRRHAENTFQPKRLYDSLPPDYRKKYPTLEKALNAEDPDERIPPPEELCPSASPTGTAATVARTVLRSSPAEWNINTSKKCISLKSPSNFCYTPLTTQDNPGHRLANSGAKCSRRGDEYCPHFLSICVRKN